MRSFLLFLLITPVLHCTRKVTLTGTISVWSWTKPNGTPCALMTNRKNGWKVYITDGGFARTFPTQADAEQLVGNYCKE